MSKKNRRKMYEKLKASDRLSQDDGSLEKEFGDQTTPDKPTNNKMSGKGKK